MGLLIFLSIVECIFPLLENSLLIILGGPFSFVLNTTSYYLETKSFTFLIILRVLSDTFSFTKTLEIFYVLDSPSLTY